MSQRASQGIRDRAASTGARGVREFNVQCSTRRIMRPEDYDVMIRLLDLIRIWFVFLAMLGVALLLILTAGLLNVRDWLKAIHDLNYPTHHCASCQKLGKEYAMHPIRNGTAWVHRSCCSGS